MCKRIKLSHNSLITSVNYRIRFFSIKVHYGLLLISCQLHFLLGSFLAHARVYPVSLLGEHA